VDDERDPLDDPRLSEVLDDLRTAFVSEPDDGVARRHLERLRATPVGVVPLRRSRPTVAAAAVAGLAVTVLGLGGVAAANDALPGPLQDGVAAVAGVVGVDLPDGGGRRAEVPPPVAPFDLTGPDAPVDDPGRSEEAPGHGGEVPGREETAPGQTDTAGETTNKPEAPPGQTDEAGNSPEAPPGQDNVTPAPSGGPPDQPGSGAPGRTR
jgi:hypothetical protein